MNEEWRPINPNYDVSSLGRVRSWIRHTGRSRRSAALILSQSLSKGYATVPLGKGVSGRVHVLVATAFHGARPDGLVCRHINGDCLDNRAENLTWGTNKENAQDRVSHGTQSRGEKHGLAKLTWSAVGEIRASTKETVSALARRHGVSRRLIRLVLDRKIWLPPEAA